MTEKLRHEERHEIKQLAEQLAVLDDRTVVQDRDNRRDLLELARGELQRNSDLPALRDRLEEGLRRWGLVTGTLADALGYAGAIAVPPRLPAHPGSRSPRDLSAEGFVDPVTRSSSTAKTASRAPSRSTARSSRS